jgi:hypothetical protein
MKYLKFPWSSSLLGTSKWFTSLVLYFPTAYRKLQQLQETGVNIEDWQMMSSLLGESKDHLVIQVWQLVLADGIYREADSS